MIFFVNISVFKPYIYFAVIQEIWKKTAKCFMKFHESQNKQDFKTETSLRIATFVQISSISWQFV